MTSDNTDNGLEITNLNAQIAGLQKVLRQKDRFMANLSHEIRNPMNGVFGMADALSRTELDKVQTRYLNVLRDACDSMLGIANQVLDISRFESGQAVLNELNFDLRDLITAKMAEFSGRAKSRGIDLGLDTDYLVDTHIRCDKLRLEQVLSNLISNALRYTDIGSVQISVHLKVGIDPDKYHLTVSVKDTGIGIPEEKQEMVFGAFNSADPAETAARGGTGLGLAIVHDIVGLMGGKISLESTPGEGSTFVLDFDVAPATKPTQTSKVVPTVLPSAFKILLAEDNDSNAFVFTVLLEDTGVNVTRARNGKEAVEAAAKTEFDMIFMDIQMPQKNGIEATEAIRGNNNPGKKPVIIALTADVFIQQSQKFREAGFNGIVTKPVKQSELISVLSTSIDEIIS